MAVAFTQAVPREDRWAPRVTGALKLVSGASGEAEQADIDPVDLNNEQVVLYSTSTGRFYSSGVEESKLEVLTGLFHGIASADKALVAGSDKSISQLNNVSAVLFSAPRVFVQSGGSASLQSHAPVTFRDDAGSFVVEEAVDTELRGVIKSNLRLYYNQSLKLGYTAGTFRDVVRRQAASNTLVIIGNSSDRLRFETNANNLIHARGGTNYTIWTAHNHGAGSGLNADLLDGVQGSNYLRADVDDESSGDLSANEFIVTKAITTNVFSERNLGDLIDRVDDWVWRRAGRGEIVTFTSITGTGVRTVNIGTQYSVVKIDTPDMQETIQELRFLLPAATSSDAVGRIFSFDIVELSSPDNTAGASYTDHDFQVRNSDGTLLYSRTMSYNDTLSGTIGFIAIGGNRWAVAYDNLVES